MYFYTVFACRCLRALFSNRPKILHNTLVEQVARQIAFERLLLRAFKLQKPPRETSRLLLEASRGALELSWALLGDSWSALGGSWGALGRSCGALGALLGGSWAILERSWALLAGPWDTKMDFPEVLIAKIEFSKNIEKHVEKL